MCGLCACCTLWERVCGPLFVGHVIAALSFSHAYISSPNCAPQARALGGAALLRIARSCVSVRLHWIALRSCYCFCFFVIRVRIDRSVVRSFPAQWFVPFVVLLANLSFSQMCRHPPLSLFLSLLLSLSFPPLSLHLFFVCPFSAVIVRYRLSRSDTAASILTVLCRFCRNIIAFSRSVHGTRSSISCSTPLPPFVLLPPA